MNLRRFAADPRVTGLLGSLLFGGQAETGDSKRDSWGRPQSDFDFIDGFNATERRSQESPWQLLGGGDEVAGGPSFDLSFPKIPGRDVEGIPNANDPVMREKLKLRFIKNQGGQELPGFLKKA